MPAKSKSQQRLFGMAYAARKGEIPKHVRAFCRFFCAENSAKFVCLNRSTPLAKAGCPMRQFSILKGEGENQAEDASANGKNMEIWHRKSFGWG